MSNKYISDNRPTFPMWELDGNGQPKMAEFGMTLRDYFAAKAMQGFCADPNMPNLERCARLAYEMADAMIKAREVQDEA